jgi:alpha/beta superfamily hydrolase
MTPTTPATTELRLGGTVERPVFLGEAGEAVFACLHAPEGAARGLVVLCSSIGAEWKYDYRREVLLARRLAAGGLAAVRFHYLGTGNSDDGHLDFPRMVHDARLAERWAAEETGVGATAYFGAKLGAFVAAAAGPRLPLVAWSAPPTGAAYFRELFRVAQVSLLAAGGTGDGPRADLAAGRAADVAGYTLPPALYDSVAGLSFAAELGAPPRPVHLVDFAADDHGRRLLATQAAALADAGFAVSSACFDGDSSWWLDNADWAAEEDRESVRALLDATASWLAATTPVGSR